MVVMTFYKMLCGEKAAATEEILFIPEIIMKSNKAFVLERSAKENAIDKQNGFC